MSLISVDKKIFTSHINVDNGYTNVSQGDHQSTMELFKYPNGTYGIEWDIPSLDMVEHIGIWHENKVVTDYDGVFELPKEAIELLEANGFNCDEIKESQK